MKRNGANFGYISGETSLADFAKGISNHSNIYYCKFRDEDEGLYVQVNVDTMLAPDKKRCNRLLTVSDMSQQVIAEKIINRVVEQEFDFIALIDIASGNIDRIIDRMGNMIIPPGERTTICGLETGRLPMWWRKSGKHVPIPTRYRDIKRPGRSGQ